MISRWIETVKGVLSTTNYAEYKAKSAKTTLIKPWNSSVEHDDQEEKKTIREKVKFFEMKYLTPLN
jgi:hypothetical protein